MDRSGASREPTARGAAGTTGGLRTTPGSAERDAQLEIADSATKATAAEVGALGDPPCGGW